MKRTIMVISIITCILGMYAANPCFADTTRENNVMIVVDGSHLMNKKWGKETRIAIVKKALPAALKEVAKTPDWGFNMGMRIFGDQSELAKGDCADLRLGTPIEWMNPGILSMVVESIHPKGKTCLAHGIFSAQDDFAGKAKNSYSCLIVLTSGIDDCKISEFTAFKYMINEKHAVDSVHIVGLNLSEKDAEYLAKIAKAHDSYMVNVTDSANLEAELIKVLSYPGKGLEMPAVVPATKKPAE